MTDVRLPDSYVIPDQAITEWAALPPQAIATTALTKQQVDHLFFAINKIILSQDWLQACLIHTSNGRTEEGNSALNLSKSELIEAQNRLRQFMTEVMLTATRRS